MRQQFILVVDYLSRSIINAVQSLRDEPTVHGAGILLLTHQPERYGHFIGAVPGVSIVIVPCAFETEAAVGSALNAYVQDVIGIACRGDMRIQYLRKLVPLLGPDVLVASVKSLEIATNKQLMRQAFTSMFPEITPRFVEITESDDGALDSVEAAMQYPVIVKPANLASSLLIQSCASRDELSVALTGIFASIHNTYVRENRHDSPQVIVEEYLEGDFYSIDAYVMNQDEMYFCPPVAYIPAKQLGVNDFFLYKRFVPVSLDAHEITAANNTVQKALTAVGLTHSTAHVELVRTGAGWKVIEIGPRIGRFRIKMYALGYGIDHSLNDVKIHMGLPPIIPRTSLRHCAAYSIYPHTEGVLHEIAGIDKLAKYPSVVWTRVTASPGDQCLYARHGGHALAEFIIASDDEAEYNRTVAYIEHSVHAIIDTNSKL